MHERLVHLKLRVKKVEVSRLAPHGIRRPKRHVEGQPLVRIVDEGDRAGATIESNLYTGIECEAALDVLEAYLRVAWRRRVTPIDGAGLHEMFFPGAKNGLGSDFVLRYSVEADGGDLLYQTARVSSVSPVTVALPWCT